MPLNVLRKKLIPFKYKHTLTIMVLLYINGEMNQTQLAEELDIKSRQGISNSLKMLEKVGWIETKEVPPNIELINLTEKGKVIATHAKNLSDAID